MRVAQLDPRRHQGAITDREFAKFSEEALALAKAKPLVIDYDDPEFTGPGERLGSTEYEAFVAGGDADFAWKMPDDEWDAISLNYTSGTTGATPKAWSTIIAGLVCWRWATS